MNKLFNNFQRCLKGFGRSFYKSKKVCATLFIVIGVFIAQWIILKKSDFQTRTIIMRIEFIMFIQVVMFSFSYIQWNHLKEYPIAILQLVEVKDQFYNHDQECQDTSGNVNMENHSRRYMESSCQQTLLKNDKILPIWKISLWTYFCLCHLSYFTNLLLRKNFDDPYWISMLSYACLGSFIQLNASYFILKLMFLLLRTVKNQGISISFLPYTTRFDRAFIASLSLIYMLLASTIGLYTASQPPCVNDVKIPIKDLPKNLNGLKLVQLSDIHIGPTVGYSKLKMIAELVNKQKPGRFK